MEQKLFAREMERLKDHFSGKQYSNELVKIFWNEFGHWDYQTFQKLVFEFIATRPINKPPLRDDFKEMAKTFGLKYDKPNLLTSCNDCRFCGVVMTEHVVTGHEMVWSCTCDLGKSILKNIQSIDFASQHGYQRLKEWRIV